MGTTVGIGNRVGGGNNFSWSSYWTPTIPLSGETPDFWVKEGSRSGITLTDSINSPTGNVTIFPVILKPGGRTTANGNTLNTDIPLTANSVWVFKTKTSLFSGTWLIGPAGGNYNTGGSHFKLYAGYASGQYKVGLRWGNTSAPGTTQVSDAWKTFIIYDKRVWMLPVTTELTDASILNVIATVAPDVNLAGAAWSINTDTLKYFYTQESTTITYRTNIKYSFIGTITDNVITWQAKHIFNNHYYVYDLLGVKHFPIVLNGGTLPTLTFDKDYGNTDLLDNGYSVYLKDGSRDLQVPYKLNGEPQVNPGVYAGYVWDRDIAGNATDHNLADSMLLFAGAQWDRSDTDIWSDLARAAGTFYDVANPKMWHISELNNLLFSEWINEGYRNQFVKIDPNSVDPEMRNSLLELFSYTTAKSESDINKALKYCGDYNIIVV